MIWYLTLYSHRGHFFCVRYVYFSYIKYIFQIILTYIYFNAGLSLKTEYFYSVELVTEYFIHHFSYLTNRHESINLLSVRRWISIIPKMSLKQYFRVEAIYYTALQRHPTGCLYGRADLPAGWHLVEGFWRPIGRSCTRTHVVLDTSGLSDPRRPLSLEQCQKVSGEAVASRDRQPFKI